MASTDGAPVFKAAVIGLGFIGAGDQVSGDALGQQVADLDGTHAGALSENPYVALVAGSSRDAGRRERFVERLGVENVYENWRAMLASEELDIVSVATHSPFHAEITIACAEAGVRAVLCEKPIATRLRDADRMIETCRQHGTLLAVNHSRRWHVMWRAIRDEVRAGTFGTVEHVVVHWGTGRLGNVGTHLFDAVAMLLASRPVSVSGTLDPDVHPDCRGPQYHDPGGWGIVMFENGVRAFVNAAQVARATPECRVVGSLGQISIRRSDAHLELWNGETRLITSPKDRPTALAVAVEDVVHCLTHGGSAASTGEDGRRALEVIMGFHASDRLRGQWVDLPLSGSDRDVAVKIG